MFGVGTRFGRQRRDGFDRRSIKLLFAGWLPHVPVFDGAVLTLKIGRRIYPAHSQYREFPWWPPPPLPTQAGVLVFAARRAAIYAIGGGTMRAMAQTCPASSRATAVSTVF